MIKLSGAFLIICCGALLGVSKVQKLNLQLKYLIDMSAFLNSLINDLHFKKSNSKSALKLAVNQLKYLPLIINFESNNIKLEIAKAYNAMPNNAKNEIFYNALKQFGTIETNLQIKQLEYSKRSIDECIKKEQTKFDCDKKLYSALGLFAGIVTVLLLV